VEDVPQVVMSEPEYKIVPVTPEDTEKVLEHLRRFFYREEPLNIYIKLLGENMDEDCAELDQYSAQTIPEGIRIFSQGLYKKVLNKEFRLQPRRPIYKLQNHVNAIPQINYSNICPCPSCYGV
jgi:hypothetical protein